MQADKSYIIDNFISKSTDYDKHEFNLELQKCRFNAHGHITTGKSFFFLNNFNNNGKILLFEEIKNVTIQNTSDGHFIPPVRDDSQISEIITKTNGLILGVQNGDNNLDIYTAYFENNPYLHFTYKCTLQGTFTEPVAFKQFYQHYYIANGNDKIYALYEDAIITVYTDPDAVPVASCLEEYKNYLFAGGNPNSPNTIFVSALNDGLDWTGEFGSYDNFFNVGLDDSDTIVGLQNYNDKLYIFKEKSIWILQGYSFDSFQIYKISDRGCVGKRAIRVLNNVLYFIGDDLMLYRITDTIENISYGKIDLSDIPLDYDLYLYSDDTYLYISYKDIIYDTITKTFLFNTPYTYFNIIRTKIIDGHEFYIGISAGYESSIFNILVNNNHDIKILKKYYDSYTFSKAFITFSPRIIFNFYLSDDNQEKLLKYFYINMYKEDSRTCRIIIRDGSDNIGNDVILYKEIGDMGEIDNIYRLPLIQIKKAITVEIFLQGTYKQYDDNKEKINDFVLKKVGFLYNERRRKKKALQNI